MYPGSPYKTTFGSSLHPLVCRSAHVVFFCFIVISNMLSYIMSYALRTSYKRQELLTLPEQLGSPAVFGRFYVVNLFGFLCFVFCFICLRPVSYVPNVARFS